MAERPEALTLNIKISKDFEKANVLKVWNQFYDEQIFFFIYQVTGSNFKDRGASFVPSNKDGEDNFKGVSSMTKLEHVPKLMSTDDGPPVISTHQFDIQALHRPALFFFVGSTDRPCWGKMWIRVVLRMSSWFDC